MADTTATTGSNNTPPPVTTGGTPTTTGAPGGDAGTIISGLIDFFNSLSGKTGNQQTAAAAAADPFASQRGQYQQQLLALMQNPSSIFQDPAFQASEQLGLQGVSRSMSAQGFGGSGNEEAELFKYGQSAGLNFFNQQVSNLTTLSGATSGSPAAAGGILANQPNATNAGTAAGINAITSLLQQSGLPASVISAITKALGGSTTSINPGQAGPNDPGGQFNPTGGDSPDLTTVNATDGWTSGSDLPTGDTSSLNDILNAIGL